MPKSEIKKIESEDLAELGDEALDRAGVESEMICFSPGQCATCGSPR